MVKVFFSSALSYGALSVSVSSLPGLWRLPACVIAFERNHIHGSEKMYNLIVAS